MPYHCEDQLRKKAILFLKKLTESGIAAVSPDIVYRDYLAKLSVKNAGYINVYYSPKRDEYSIKLNELRDKSLTSAIQACWDTLNTPTADQPESVPQNPFEEVEYYLTQLKPYRHLAFDFSAIADALRKILPAQHAPLPTDDYDALEAHYRQIKETVS